MENIGLQIINLLIGAIPEIIYITLSLIYFKDIKNKQFILLVAIAFSYISCIMISQYNIFYYLMFYILCYIFLRILYKEKIQINDIFLILFITLYLSLTSIISFQFVKDDFSNYYILAIISKILLFIPFIFKDKLNLIYKNYCKLWNRNDLEKRHIKSITLRNICMIILNCFFIISNLVFIYIQNRK